MQNTISSSPLPSFGPRAEFLALFGTPSYTFSSPADSSDVFMQLLVFGCSLESLIDGLIGPADLNWDGAGNEYDWNIIRYNGQILSLCWGSVFCHSFRWLSLCCAVLCFLVVLCETVISMRLGL